MCELKLVKPSMDYAEDIMAYRQEFVDAEDNLAGAANLKDCTSAQEWIETITAFGDEATCPAGFVTSDNYLAVRTADNKIVGMIDFRHHINHPVLSVWGGHIGYSVRPCERRKGYAKEMLRQVLEVCRARGLDRVLITCNPKNTGSNKTILANGGVFEKEVVVDDARHNRYWIEL